MEHNHGHYHFKAQGAAIKKPYQYTPIKIEKPEIVHHPAEV